MNNIKYTLPFLMLILFVPVAMSDTFAQGEPGEEDFTNDIGPVGNVDSVYLEVLKQSDDFQNFNSTQQQQYVIKFIESRDNLSPYDQAVNDGLEVLSDTILALHKAKALGENTVEETKFLHSAIFDLELLGVVSKDRLDQNKEYWSDRVTEATRQLEDNETNKVSYLDKLSNTYKIHTDDVSLKNQSEIFYPCIQDLIFLPIPLYCSEKSIVWGGDTISYANVTFVPLSFLSEHLGKICLNESVAHSTVNFAFDVDFEQENVLGQETWSYSKSYDTSLSGSTAGFCAQDSKITGINAGSSASTTTHLESLITVSG